MIVDLSSPTYLVQVAKSGIPLAIYLHVHISAHGCDAERRTASAHIRLSIPLRASAASLRPRAACRFASNSSRLPLHFRLERLAASLPARAACRFASTSSGLPLRFDIERLAASLRPRAASRFALASSGMPLRFRLERLAAALPHRGLLSSHPAPPHPSPCTPARPSRVRPNPDEPALGPSGSKSLNPPNIRSVLGSSGSCGAVPNPSPLQRWRCRRCLPKSAR